MENVITQIEKSKVNKLVDITIKSNRLINQRVADLIELGFEEDEKSMGSGGVGQVKVIKGIVYKQVSCGWGRYNYAVVVKIGQIRQTEQGGEYFLPIM